ncbi:DUF421 domain-containing protein [Sutcliffiella horikoshii]|uniref:DUF421 domain-containing protein n=1 Tax=Sutcliffiella horikoshii TaxID=79883 RepID=UPI001F38FCBC|nr:DUF421 domain-containing protein [Sutcliffiella horikoshii]MCG1020745.1 DUF421 domain-containing protein [Sutcliffiella horikoshii]
MDLNWIWKAILITIIGTFLLRIAGRKSISQMTLAQVVIMIGIGSLLIQPLAGKSIWVTFGVGITLVVTLVMMELLQLKSDIFEKLITGKAKVLIENGKLNEKTLKKLRFTIDQLEMKLRQNSISSISDVKWATLEPNGQLGFELTDQAKPITKKEWNLLYQEIQLLKIMIDPSSKPSRINEEKNGNLFTEVKNGKHKLKERPSETLD